MKKILLLLVSVFCTLSVFGQSRMDYTRVNTVIQVGDTLVVKYQYFKGTDATGADMPDATLYQFDIQYNNKLLSVISNDWQPTMYRLITGRRQFRLQGHILYLF